jgi:probable phosphoglycerate mutase
MFIYLIRHGEPDYKTDTLTEIGLKQAELLSERFSAIKFDKIFSSPLGRAKQTAMPTCIKQNKDFKELQWLNENSAYNAMTIDIEGKRDWWFAVQNSKIRKLEDAKRFIPEQTQAFCDSVASGFDELLSELGYKKCSNGYQITNNANTDDRIALFCHDGISRVILSYALAIPFHIFCASFCIPHTGVTVLNLETTTDRITAPRCMMFSDLSHLYSSQLKNIYNNNLDI